MFAQIYKTGTVAGIVNDSGFQVQVYFALSELL